MIAQLTHLRPRPGCMTTVIELIKEWGVATRDDSERPAYSFLSQADEHLFVVSLHADQGRYEAAAAASAAWLDRLMPLLVDNHGPTYHGPVLAQNGRAQGEDMPFPSALGIAGSRGRIGRST